MAPLLPPRAGGAWKQCRQGCGLTVNRLTRWEWEVEKSPTDPPEDAGIQLNGADKAMAAGVATGRENNTSPQLEASSLSVAKERA